MKRINQITLFTAMAVIVYACGGGVEVSEKMAQLEELKKQKVEIDSKISQLEQELIASGELENNGAKNKVLVSALEIKPGPFQHKVDVRGSVSSKKNVMLTSETMGKISSISVKEGQKVSQGQLLIQLDADVIRNSFAEVETQLELANEVFERQSRLWKQNIGTEIQYLQAKTNKESLERKLKTLNSQLDMAAITAPFSGLVDDIPVKLGEVLQPGIPVIRLVNPDDVYITADVSESFLGRFSKNQEVEVYFPSQDKRIVSKIESIGQMIKTENRTFEIEIDLPKVDFPVKPNQVVVIKLVDYNNENALVVPTRIVQKDSKGSYVYEIVNQDGGQVARKVHVETGISFEQETEIKSGLKPGQLIANKGYRDLAENASIIIAE